MLGIVEECVPGRDPVEKLGVLGREGLWLELAYMETRDLSILKDSGMVRTVQAFRLHDLSPVSPDPGERRAAQEHIKATMELANLIGAPQVLVVPGYGFEHCNDPEVMWTEQMALAGDYARRLDVDLLVESLGPKRTSFHPSLSGVAHLVEQLSHPAVHLMADTMQVYNSGEDVYATLEEYAPHLKELQLRDTGSLPPGKGDLDFGRILKICKGVPMCLEYTPRDVEEDFRWALDFVRGKA